MNKRKYRSSEQIISDDKREKKQKLIMMASVLMDTMPLDDLKNILGYEDHSDEGFESINLVIVEDDAKKAIDINY